MITKPRVPWQAIVDAPGWWARAAVILKFTAHRYLLYTPAEFLLETVEHLTPEDYQVSYVLSFMNGEKGLPWPLAMPVAVVIMLAVLVGYLALRVVVLLPIMLLCVAWSFCSESSLIFRQNTVLEIARKMLNR